jgi:hypothetical protein
MIQEVKQICLALCLDEMSILYTFYRYFRTALIYISLFPKMNEIKLRNKDNLFILILFLPVLFYSIKKST